MPRDHHQLPRCWLMTDERMGDALWCALERLPRGAGVVFRHYRLDPAARRALFAQVARVARRRRLVLVAGGDATLKGAAARHGGRGAMTAPAHNAREVIAARRSGAALILISPVFATRSHPDTRPLGMVRAAALARLAQGRGIALGGVCGEDARRLKEAGFFGWAAIDAWLAGDQKRSAAPRNTVLPSR